MRGHNKRLKRKYNTILFLLYFIFAIYFVNFKIPLLDVPQLVTKVNDWIITFGGLLLFFSGLRFLVSKKAKIME